MQGLRPEEIEALQILHAKLEKGDWYDLLGLEPDFEDGELKRAYYDLSRRYHPDRFYRRDIAEHQELIEQVFAGINKAYNTLRDSTERRRYNALLEKKTGVRRPARKKPAAKPAARTEPADPSEVVMDVGHRKGERPRRAAGAKARPAARKTGKKSRPVPPHILKLRKQIAQRLAKARKYHQEALKEIEQGQYVKAASSLYLACQYDPKNQEYKRLHADVAERASGARVAQFMAEAESAESYRNVKKAIYNYEKAIEYDPPQGKPYFNLAELLVNFEDDDRGALAHYRRAVEKEPSNTRYRLALAAHYQKLEMNRNAKREYQAVLEQDPKNVDAREGLKKVRFA